jgi:hypothetical protein
MDRRVALAFVGIPRYEGLQLVSSTRSSRGWQYARQPLEVALPTLRERRSDATPDPITAGSIDRPGRRG